MKKIVILRGLPGSGKSTKVMERYPDAVVCSADNYFINPLDGVYRYNPERIGDAHKWCRFNAIAAADASAPVIVVDNTNIKYSDFRAYLEIAEAYGYEVELVESDTEWKWDVDECAKRNVHGVPREAIQRMKDRWMTFTEILSAAFENNLHKVLTA